MSYPSKKGNEVFLTRRELEVRWKVSKSTVVRAEKDGLVRYKLPAVRYKLSDVITYEGQRRVV